MNDKLMYIPDDVITTIYIKLFFESLKTTI